MTGSARLDRHGSHCQVSPHDKAGRARLGHALTYAQALSPHSAGTSTALTSASTLVPSFGPREALMATAQATDSSAEPTKGRTFGPGLDVRPAADGDAARLPPLLEVTPELRVRHHQPPQRLYFQRQRLLQQHVLQRRRQRSGVCLHNHRVHAVGVSQVAGSLRFVGLLCTHKTQDTAVSGSLGIYTSAPSFPFSSICSRRFGSVAAPASVATELV